jgi:hypothetical protein
MHHHHADEFLRVAPFQHVKAIVELSHAKTAAPGQ